MAVNVCWVLIVLQALLVVLFAVYVRYEDNYDAMKYPLFQDIHVMLFVGFGFLMSFLKRYGFSSVGFTLLLASCIIQWAMLCQGFARLDDDYKIRMGIVSVYKADIAAGVILISTGAVLGRVSLMQLIAMGFLETVVYCINLHLGSEVLRAIDAGGSMFVHVFGAYFGLSVSIVIERTNNADASDEISLRTSNYSSDLFAMIGTLFLWLYWPSFNAVDLTGAEQQRAIINTYLSLAACCVLSFACSILTDNDKKLDMMHVQNATLAGGVAIGAVAGILKQPWVAVVIGSLAGIISVLGYAKLMPILETNFRLYDTCGVHNLHGMPGLLASVASAVIVGVTSETGPPDSLYQDLPGMNSSSDSRALKANLSVFGARKAGEQAGYQIAALTLTMTMAVIGGAITGKLYTG
ncbi:unnamed protein product [Acanthoscelides obtectus]|uniref:Ammonium transporter AmtB-like domain-containing protein n=1 Tax=Acanthoscelides obtectus TaxID=200917 RepID=A0A9P0M9R2_ACAOB|nr:unnamed protein product [Acanthoscelides obtectus]CAK1685737.1 Ammonium transporter Rh type B-A [Acanthoscelides obtectus]